MWLIADDIIDEIAPGCPPVRTHEFSTCLLSREERLQIYDRIIDKVQIGSRKVDPMLLLDLQKQALEKLHAAKG